MADGLNKVILIGQLGADPELKYTQGNQAVLRLRLATSESWMPKEGGERQQRTEWHNVVVWGRRAEALNKIMNKGRQIYVEGRIQSRQWEDQQGQKRNATDIVANEILLLGGRREGSPESRSGGEYDRPRGNGAGDFGGGGDFSDDDIPFSYASRGIEQ